jgi:hypothetical protein
MPKILNNMDDSSKFFCNQNNINININAHKIKKKFQRNSLIIMRHKSNYLENTYINLNNNNEKYPLYYYFFGDIYNRADFQKKRKRNFLCITEKFYKSFSFYKNLIDITSYISLYKDFEIFKKIVNDKLNANDTNSFGSDLKNNPINNKSLPDENSIIKNRSSSKNNVIQPIKL